MATAVDSSTFQKEVLESDLPVLVDFWAEWCGPCKVIEPVIDELATEYDGKLKFVKLNVDESQDVASKFGVMSIPTFIVFSKGQKVDSFVGAMPKEMFTKHIDEILAKPQ